MLPLYNRTFSCRASSLDYLHTGPPPSRFGHKPWESGQIPLVGPDTWCVKEEEVEADLWECAVLESAVAAEMENFEQDMEEDQPLDLSMKPRAMESSPQPAPRPLRPDGKPHGQDSPLCLIKDCGCNNHGPRARAIGGASIYDCGKYGPPQGDLPTSGHTCHFSAQESVESRYDDRNGFENRRACYDQADVPGLDMCRQNAVERSWAARRHPNENYRMDTSRERTRFDEHNLANRCRYKLGYNEAGEPGTNYKPPPPKAYNACDHNPQSYIDLTNSDCHQEGQWRHPTNNEERFRPVCQPLNENANPTSQWRRSGIPWNRSDCYPSQNHWRPFADTRNTSGGSGHQQSQENPKPAGTEGVASQSNSMCVHSGAAKPPPAPEGNKVQFSVGGTSVSSTRKICHSFAATVPLITNSSSVPSSKREAQSLSSTRNSGAPHVVPRVPYTTIRVTRSPKTFHNETARASPDGDNARGCPFKRPQDFNRRCFPGKMESQEKENIDLTGSGAPAVGVKMPALDYLISKVLVERIDIPFKACNTEIKKIYNGESKGRLRLVDLIELQVEESLKA